MRSPPQVERDGHRVDVDARPPRRLIAVAVEFPAMGPTDRDSLFVAPLSAKRARLGEADVMDFRWHAPAHDTGQLCDEFTVLFVAEPNDLLGDAATPTRCRSGSVDLKTEMREVVNPFCSWVRDSRALERRERPFPICLADRRWP